jgi:hypothetical protein
LAAVWTVEAVVNAFGTVLPGAFEVAVDRRVLTFTALAALATGVA